MGVKLSDTYKIKRMLAEGRTLEDIAGIFKVTTDYVAGFQDNGETSAEPEKVTAEVAKTPKPLAAVAQPDGPTETDEATETDESPRRKRRRNNSN